MNGNGIVPGKRYAAMDIGLRGTLAEEYSFRRTESQDMATQWLRELAGKAFNKDPDLVVKVQLNLHNKKKRYLIGRKSEVGMYPPDW